MNLPQKPIFILSALLLTAFTWTATQAQNDVPDAHDHAQHDQHIPEAPEHAIFDQFKALEGTWQGTVTHGSADPAPTTITYRLTANGSALIETVFAGTPMEMVSVYFLDGDTLKMTHYCIAQNQPTMVAVAGERPGVVRLEFDSITNMADSDAMHMHEATFEFLGNDHHRSTWQGYVGGQPASEMRAVLDLRRQPEGRDGHADGNAEEKN